VACLALLCLLAPHAQAAPGDPAPAEAPRREQAPTPHKAAKPEAAAPKGEPKAETARPEATRVDKPVAPAAGRDRRRRSYAACNRASHQRGYHGGRRRRFLIRCRLGYERTRTPQVQQAPAQQAPPPARKP
jgi:hypothetical protein